MHSGLILPSKVTLEKKYALKDFTRAGIKFMKAGKLLLDRSMSKIILGIFRKKIFILNAYITLNSTSSTVLEIIKKKRVLKKCQIIFDHLETLQTSSIQEVLYRCDYIHKLKVESNFISIMDILPDRNSILSSYKSMQSLNLSLIILKESDLSIFYYIHEFL